MKYFLLILSTVYSCNSYKQISTEVDDYKILKKILYTEKLQIQKVAYFNSKINNNFGIYENWYSVQKKTNHLGISFNGKIEWVFNHKDIKYMRRKYKKWKHRSWDNIDTSNIGKDIISYPLYNKNYTKAMTVVSVSNSSNKLFLLKKRKDDWVIVGRLSIGIVE